MIVVRLKGGLGNQMFQYALGRSLSLRNKVSLGLDVSFYDPECIPKRQYDLDVFNVAGSIVSKNELPFLYRICQKSKLLSKILKNKGKEKFFHFDPKVFLLGSDLYLDGYWQSPKYFSDFEHVIRKDFTLKNSPIQNIQTLAEQIKNENSVCIHVRRGDYVGNKSHEVVTLAYYKKGIEKVSAMTDIDKVYVFSDDIDWCRKNMAFEVPVIFVGDKYAGSKGEGHMHLMSQCRHFIIANSTFSWWAAWLASSPAKIVIAPKQWFPDENINTSDLIPGDWIRI